MYLKTRCPICESDIYQEIQLDVLKYMSFEGHRVHCKYKVENIDLKTKTEEELIKDILQSLKTIVHDGIKVDVLADTLMDNYGVTGACCRDLIEKIKIELDMYSPDMKTLHFVEPCC